MRRILLALLFICSAVSLQAQTLDREAIRKAISKQMKTYPESTLKDLYKNFFQDTFGPGHLMATDENAEEGMCNYLKSECEAAKKDSSLCPTYELTGWHGRFYRVNLSVVNDGLIPFETFLAAFIESAKQFSLPDVKGWRKEWRIIRKEVKRLYPTLPDYEQDSKDIDAILEKGQYASHHSRAYNEKYRPHYRLIERNIFERMLLPLINKQVISPHPCQST